MRNDDYLINLHAYASCMAIFWTKIFKNLTIIYHPAMLSDGIRGIFARFLKIFVLKEASWVYMSEQLPYGTNTAIIREIRGIREIRFNSF